MNHRTLVFLLGACVVLGALPALASQCPFGLPYNSDCMVVFDPNGLIVSSAGANEQDELNNGPSFVYTVPGSHPIPLSSDLRRPAANSDSPAALASPRPTTATFTALPTWAEACSSLSLPMTRPDARFVAKGSITCRKHGPGSTLRRSTSIRRFRRRASLLISGPTLRPSRRA